MKSSSYLLFRFVPYSILKVLKQSIMQGYFQVSFVPYSIFEVLKRVVAARSFDLGFVPYSFLKVLKLYMLIKWKTAGFVPYGILKVLKQNARVNCGWNVLYPIGLSRFSRDVVDLDVLLISFVPCNFLGSQAVWTSPAYDIEALHPFNSSRFSNNQSHQHKVLNLFRFA